MKKINEIITERLYCEDKAEIEKYRQEMEMKNYVCTSIVYIEESNKEYNLVMDFMKKL